jgi:hypothetical protein
METKNKLSDQARSDLKRIRAELKKVNPDGHLIAVLLNGDKYNTDFIR